MEQKLYWLWMQRVFGYSAWIADPLRYFGSAKAIFEATENDYRTSEIFGKTRSFSKSRLMLLLDKDLTFAQTLLQQCEKYGIEILTPQDEAYPKKLLRLPDYPAVLYVKGDLSFLNDRLSIAVIGSRTPTDYAKDAAARITGTLAEQGAVIVSGGALGIDSIAHKTALQLHQKTVLVMGCGIQSHYLLQNEPLRQAIANNGALVSEYPPMLQPSAGSFPQRNRIISGVSDGILIVEAGEHSGTLNTATHAKKQSRPIFVVPGAISSEAFAGSNRLVREGAKPVFSAEDILSYFDMVYALRFSANDAQDEISRSAKEEFQAKPVNTKKKSSSEQSAPPKDVVIDEPEETKKAHKENIDALKSKLSKNAAMVYQCIIDGKNQMDEIVLSVALPTAKVLSALTELELFGLICKGEGNYYTVNETDPSVFI